MHESKSGGDYDRFDPVRRSVLGFLLLAGLGLSGCGPKVTPRQVNLMGNTTKEEQDKIRGYLDAAGLKGPIVSVEDGGTRWLVDVGAEPPAPGKKPMPVPPSTYEVDKATGKVLSGPGI